MRMYCFQKIIVIINKVIYKENKKWIEMKSNM